MANLSIKIDLLKLQDAAVINLKGKTATKRCLVIPVDDAHLFVGQKGCYLNLTALEMQTSQFGDSHCIKQNLDRAVFEIMTAEQRKAMPILGFSLEEVAQRNLDKLASRKRRGVIDGEGDNR